MGGASSPRPAGPPLAPPLQGRTCNSDDRLEWLVDQRILLKPRGHGEATHYFNGTEWIKDTPDRLPVTLPRASSDPRPLRPPPFQEGHACSTDGRLERLVDQRILLKPRGHGAAALSAYFFNGTGWVEDAPNPLPVTSPRQARSSTNPHPLVSLPSISEDSIADWHAPNPLSAASPRQARSSSDPHPLVSLPSVSESTGEDVDEVGMAPRKPARDRLRPGRFVLATRPIHDFSKNPS